MKKYQWARNGMAEYHDGTFIRVQDAEALERTAKGLEVELATAHRALAAVSREADHWRARALQPADQGVADLQRQLAEARAELETAKWKLAGVVGERDLLRLTLRVADGRINALVRRFGSLKQPGAAC